MQYCKFVTEEELMHSGSRESKRISGQPQSTNLDIQKAVAKIKEIAANPNRNNTVAGIMELVKAWGIRQFGIQGWEQFYRANKAIIDKQVYDAYTREARRG